MKVGDYIRTLDGIIFKIKEIKDIDVYYSCNPPELKWQKQTFCILEDKNEAQPISQVKKSSPNIIDLIEVGDYVNGCYVTNIQASHNEGITIIPKKIGIIKCNAYFNQGNYNDCDFKWIEEKDIKSIVTKEMYSSVEYRVERN